MTVPKVLLALDKKKKELEKLQPIDAKFQKELDKKFRKEIKSV